jgi:hypothetical protein
LAFCRLAAGADAALLSAVFATETFLFIAYLFVYSGICRAVSLTILGRMLDADGPRTFDALMREYEALRRFEDRVEVLRRSGWVETDGDQVSLTDRGRRAVRSIRAVSNTIAGGLEG